MTLLQTVPNAKFEGIETTESNEFGTKYSFLFTKARALGNGSTEMPVKSFSDTMDDATIIKRVNNQLQLLDINKTITEVPDETTLNSLFNDAVGKSFTIYENQMVSKAKDTSKDDEVRSFYSLTEISDNNGNLFADYKNRAKFDEVIAGLPEGTKDIEGKFVGFELEDSKTTYNGTQSVETKHIEGTDNLRNTVITLMKNLPEPIAEKLKNYMGRNVQRNEAGEIIGTTYTYADVLNELGSTTDNAIESNVMWKNATAEQKLFAQPLRNVTRISGRLPMVKVRLAIDLSRYGGALTGKYAKTSALDNKNNAITLVYHPNDMQLADLNSIVEYLLNLNIIDINDIEKLKNLSPDGTTIPNEKIFTALGIISEWLSKPGVTLTAKIFSKTNKYFQFSQLDYDPDNVQPETVTETVTETATGTPGNWYPGGEVPQEPTANEPLNPFDVADKSVEVTDGPIDINDDDLPF